MKVTKKLTTTTIGEVTPNGIIDYTLEDFQGGKEAKKLLVNCLNTAEKFSLTQLKRKKWLFISRMNTY